MSVSGVELQMDGTVVLLHRFRSHCCRCCLCPLAVEQWQWASVCSVIRLPPFLALAHSLSLPPSPICSLVCSSPSATLLLLSLSLFFLFFSYVLIFSLIFSFIITLCISHMHTFYFLYPPSVLSRLGHEEGYPPPFPLLFLHLQCWEDDWKPAVFTLVWGAPISTAPGIREAERQSGLNAEREKDEGGWWGKQRRSKTPKERGRECKKELRERGCLCWWEKGLKVKCWNRNDEGLCLQYNIAFKNT